MKTILITGTAGFIGFHLAEYFLKANHMVIGIDNLNDYYSVSLKEDRLKKLGFYQAFTNYTYDINDKTSLETIFNTYEFDVVINLAAQAGVRYSLINPDIYIKSNIVGFHNMLNLSQKYKVRKLLYASSSSVYGNIQDLPFTEKMQLDEPISVYAATKKSNELLAHSYNEIYNMNCIGLRFFTVYGPWGRPDMALYLFTKAILEGKEIQIFNNGHLARDFTYIDDIIESIYRLSMSEGEDSTHEIYNIGNNKPIKLLNFVEELENKIGKKAKKNFLPMQKGDVYSTYADCSKLYSKTNFKPQVELKEGVGKFVDWYKEYYSI